MNMISGKIFSLTGFFISMVLCGIAQDADKLITRVKNKLNTVSDYTAEGILSTDVSFMKVPESEVTVYFKYPDKFKIKKHDGISVVPKGGISINLNSLFNGNAFATVSAGFSTLDNKKVAVVKLLPLDESGEVVISTLYIDEKDALIRKASTTTRENGTYEMEMTYGKYANWGLPDKVIFLFNIKDYKLPKGVTFEYDTGEKVAGGKEKEKKGRISISYKKYVINKGLPDNVFFERTNY